MILVASTIGFLCNAIIFNKPILNFMLIGMTFSATFANMVTEKRLENITKSFQPIFSRAAGKILGASFGAKITNAPLMNSFQDKHLNGQEK